MKYLKTYKLFETYFKQEKDHTCGPATLRMVLSNFIDDVPSESELEKMLDSDKEVGTTPKKMIEVAKSFGLKTKTSENGDLDELDKLIKDGWVIILLVSIEEPHYTIYLKQDGEYSVFNDPWYGENKKYSTKEFIDEYTDYPIYRWKVDPKEFEKYISYSLDVLKSNKKWIAFKN